MSQMIDIFAHTWTVNNMAFVEEKSEKSIF